MLFGNLSIKFDRKYCDKYWIKDKDKERQVLKGQRKASSSKQVDGGMVVYRKKNKQKQDQKDHFMEKGKNCQKMTEQGKRGE